MVPLGSGDTSHNHSASSILQSGEIKEFTSSELTAALSAAMEVIEFGTSKSEDKK